VQEWKNIWNARSVLLQQSGCHGGVLMWFGRDSCVNERFIENITQELTVSHQEFEEDHGI